MTVDSKPSEPRPLQWAERKFSGRMRPRDAAYLVAACWLAAVIVFAIVERIADPKTFNTIWLALWWAIQTVTTVGYGDIVPSQATGKTLAAILMLVGLALLSIITATITSAFVARRQAELQKAGKDPVMQKLEQLSTRLDAIESALRDLRRG